MAPTHIDNPFSIRELTFSQIASSSVDSEGLTGARMRSKSATLNIINWMPQRTCGFKIISQGVDNKNWHSIIPTGLTGTP